METGVIKMLRNFTTYMTLKAAHGKTPIVHKRIKSIFSYKLCKGYKPKTVHSVRERTDRGP